MGAFDDHAAFHLGEGSHDVEEKFSVCGGGVESFCEGKECDASFAEHVDSVDDMAAGSSWQERQCSAREWSLSRRNRTI